MFKGRHTYTNKLIKPIIFNPHTLDSNRICIPSHFFNPKAFFIQATFIDPGTVSCAFRIVRFFYKINIVEVIWFGILKFGKTIQEIISNTETQLTPILDHLIHSHYIVIESQPLKRKDVFRCTQHIISFLCSRMSNNGVKGVIVEVDPKLKTCWIGGPATRIQNDGISIKQWSKDKAIEILTMRDDQLSLSTLSSSLYKGREDLSDVVCYEYAWWSYYSSRNEIPKSF